MVDGRRPMERLVLLVVIAAVAAGAVVYTVHRAQSTPQAHVTSLLPRGTIAFGYFPDFKRTRDEWRQSDLSKLYQEPAVQDFLNKPLSRIPQRDAASETASDFERLDIKDAFVAVGSIDNNNPHLIGGFGFHGSQSEAEKIIGKWRSKIVRNPSVHQTEDYEQHKIDIVGAAPNQVATVYDEQWFFASNDLVELKAVLDRADQRTQDKKSTLEADDAFLAAMKHMPSSYGLLLYLQPRKLSESLASLRHAIGLSGDQNTVIDQIQRVCAAARFDKGKIHDVLFVGMPRSQSEEKLT